MSKAPITSTKPKGKQAATQAGNNPMEPKLVAKGTLTKYTNSKAAVAVSPPALLLRAGCKPKAAPSGSNNKQAKGKVSF
jgi:hypothetical protein